MDCKNLVNEVFERANKVGILNSFNMYLSLGCPDYKAEVKVLTNRKERQTDILDEIEQYYNKHNKWPVWIKLDFIVEETKILFNELVEELEKTRRNYVKFGISLDEYYLLSFLPEEINANAFVRPTKDKKKLYLSEANVNNYIKKYKDYHYNFRIDKFSDTLVTKFYTKSYMIDENHIYELEDDLVLKGLRKVDNLSLELDSLIKKSTAYLKNEVQDNGKFNYGYFPHFNKEISFYNNLRHSSSTYALIEGLAYQNKEINDVGKCIDYIIDNCLLSIEDYAYIYDETKNINEIKLGQNAAFIFAVCEYIKYQGNNYDYLRAAQKAAKGILQLIDDKGETIHVLNYPDLSVKNKFRVIYYDGEAALALLRLYQLDHNPLWLNEVRKLFRVFINKSYWKYHDHWLGYCTNELVKIDPNPEYIKFGLQNVASYLDFIKNRETTFPTFLEMLIATYHLVDKAKAIGFTYLVEELLDEDKFLEVIHYRANFQRLGFFYPEVAMYFKKPSVILNSFFIKHHGYRVRIDDLEHYISGFVQYQKVFNK